MAATTFDKNVIASALEKNNLLSFDDFHIRNYPGPIDYKHYKLSQVLFQVLAPEARKGQSGLWVDGFLEFYNDAGCDEMNFRYRAFENIKCKFAI